MSMEEYEIECLRNESEMEDEESRKDSQIVNEAWIDALELALERIERIRGEAILYMDYVNDMTMENHYPPKEKRGESDNSHERIFRTIRNALNGIRNDAAMLLPKDHEQYMDQQGDEPNKNKGE